MKRFSLGHDGVTETIIDLSDDEIIARDVQDVTPILDQNQTLRGERQNLGSNFRHVGSIPVTIFHEWRKEWRNKYAKDWTWKTYLAMKMNSRDYSQLRTSDLRI